MTEALEAFVHKAVVPLIGDESVGTFSTKIKDSARNHLKTALSLGDKDSIYAAEVFGDSVVLNSYKYNDYGSSGSKYYQVPYTRDKKGGDFTFGTPVEVMPVMTYEPVNDEFSVAKRLLGNIPDEEKFLIIRKASWKKTSLFNGVI
jgi:hypothetical protein